MNQKQKNPSLKIGSGSEADTSAHEEPNETFLITVADTVNDADLCEANKANSMRVFMILSLT